MSNPKGTVPERVPIKKEHTSPPSESNGASEMEKPVWGDPKRKRQKILLTKMIRIPPPYSWFTVAGWDLPRNSNTLKVFLHSKGVLRSGEAAKLWNRDHPGSNVKAGDSLPTTTLVLGEYSWDDTGYLVAKRPWMSLYVAEEDVRTAACPISTACRGQRWPLRLMPMVDFWRDGDGLLVANWTAGCVSSVYIEFEYNGIRFDPNNLPANAHPGAKEYGWFWWFPDQEPYIRVQI